MKRGGREHCGTCDVYNATDDHFGWHEDTVQGCTVFGVWRGSYPTMVGAIEALDPFQSARVESLKGARLMTELCAMVGV